MKLLPLSSITAVAMAALAGPTLAQAPAIPPSIVTPDTIETRAGTLEFKDGAPSPQTVEKAYDTLDFTRALQAFVDTYQGASLIAARKGFLDAGIKDNEIVLFSKLMDSNSLFLTANADTVYFLGFVDLTNGPMVVETPPGALGTIDDMWFRWVIDFGRPGPDRGVGGRYLLLPPGYSGPLPQDGYFVARSQTNRVMILGRSFLVKDDPAPAAAVIKEKTKIYPYEPGGYGTSIAEFLEGKSKLAGIKEPSPTVFHEGSGKVMNTIPPYGLGYYEMLNEAVQSEPATALDPELMGPLASIGIVKGKPFAPDDRMKKILTDAAALGTATSRSLGMRPRDNDWFYYKDSSWTNALFTGGYLFETPIPEITAQGVKPFPPTGYRKLDARTWFFYWATGITPAMAMRLPDIGSQYLIAMYDADRNYLDGAKTYKVTLPKNIPAAAFWSFTLYDNQTRSMLQTPQKYPRAGSQNYPSPAAEPDADGSTTVYFAPAQPEGVKRGNWIQTDPKKGWFTILRLYSPLESFFDKSWRPGEVEMVSAPKKEGLLERIEQRVDKREDCRKEAEAQKLGAVERVRFVEKCMQ